MNCIVVELSQWICYNDCSLWDMTLSKVLEEMAKKTNFLI